MAKILVLTDGHSYTTRYVASLLAEGYEVYVQVAPGVTQTTEGHTKTIDLFDLADVQQAVKNMDFISIIGDPVHSYTSLTQGSRHVCATLVYHNLAVAINQSNVKHIMVIQTKTSPLLREAFELFDFPITYNTLRTQTLDFKPGILSQVTQDIHSVRSIQTLNIPIGITMEGALSLYGRFLRTLHGRLINGVYDGENFTILLSPFNIPLIKMRHAKHSERTSRVIMNITGGLLVGSSARQSRFEIRRLGHDTAACMIGLHDFVPRLPWWLYRIVQAPLHVIVSQLFRKYWEKF
ncbi:hypothetical protein [Staphylococcus americanisciuri]|uniref:NAD(P)-binding domain-containing protein n=1 Tax=Staphylococcus americanisciuri TaxID=2973940 RepID=A0ABT2F3X3_9STAP|nr:hypothetical protein [Staphylococcus americanisciuri]MCS4487087.1 hypothetical protein [Staphylococcus americanisciuri]